jgi:predicted short-subunit dehydrogenase-like oxidoreductase (DUF2520 family)
MTLVRIIGPGRAGLSMAAALTGAGWQVDGPWGRDHDPAPAASGCDLLLLAVPDHAVAPLAGAVRPNPSSAVAHLSGSLGLAPLAQHPRPAVLHPLVALADPELGAARLRGAAFGVASGGDPLALDAVAALEGRAIEVSEGAWAAYHAAAVIASNHLVGLLGQVERVAAGVGAPLDAYLDLARQTIENVAALGPAAALTGPVRRGDRATVERHLAALDPNERHTYRAMVDELERLCRPPAP